MWGGGENTAVYILWKYDALFSKGQKFIISKICEGDTIINAFVTVKGVGGAFDFFIVSHSQVITAIVNLF